VASPKMEAVASWRCTRMNAPDRISSVDWLKLFDERSLVSSSKICHFRSVHFVCFVHAIRKKRRFHVYIRLVRHDWLLMCYLLTLLLSAAADAAAAWDADDDDDAERIRGCLS